MKATTALNKIKKIIESIDYERVYVEIETKNDKYTLEQEKEKNIIGFKQ
jgi:hypothetical protein